MRYKLYLSIFVFSFFFLFFGIKDASAATLSLSPASKQVSVNDTFVVSVMLDTQGETTDGVDAIIFYDSGKLSITSVSLGDLYANKLQEDYSTGGQITLRATSTATTSFTGSGTFATITFKAISDGNANVDFQFTAGSSTDSNVAKEGQDLLTSVSGAVYTISPSGGVGGGEETTLPETGIITPTILLASLGFLFILAPLFL